MQWRWSLRVSAIFDIRFEDYRDYSDMIPRWSLARREYQPDEWTSGNLGILLSNWSGKLSNEIDTLENYRLKSYGDGCDNRSCIFTVFVMAGRQ